LAILHQALQRVSDISKAFPDGAISGIGGIRGFREAFNFIVHGAGNLQICTAAMEEKGSGGIGVELIKELKHHSNTKVFDFFFLFFFKSEIIFI
jgi:dihydroorotate dehydrogenase